MRKIFALTLSLALLVCMGVTAFAELDTDGQDEPSETASTAAGEPEEALAEDAPELEEPAEISDEQQEPLPETLPALAPAAPQGTNPDTGDSSLLAGAIAGAVASATVLVLATQKKRKG